MYPTLIRICQCGFALSMRSAGSHYPVIGRATRQRFSYSRQWCFLRFLSTSSKIASIQCAELKRIFRLAVSQATSFNLTMQSCHGNDLTLGEDSMNRQVRLSRQARSTHLYVSGATGTGKSKFLEHLIWQDIV